MPDESGPRLSPEELRYVYWYTCNCPWLTKFCDEKHRATARVPVSVLREYDVNAPARKDQADA